MDERRCGAYAPIKRVTVNGKSYTKGETIYTIDTGVYEVVVIDHEVLRKTEKEFVQGLHRISNSGKLKSTDSLDSSIFKDIEELTSNLNHVVRISGFLP